MHAIDRRRLVLAGLALAAALALVYAPVVGHDFVDFDDRVYVADNPEIASGLGWDGVRWAFTTGYAANWHPLTWLSHMLDVELFGLEPGAMAAANVGLHALASVLLLVFLARATGAFWPALGVAALFALHPLRVESVAWIAERKDVLAGVFFMATLLAWLGWVRRPGRLRSAWVVAMLALGLMSKPTVVTLPFVLLLLDVWPLRRLERGNLRARLIEKGPLFALVAASCWLTLRVQQAGGAMRDVALSPLDLRIANAITAYATYLRKLVWPSDLAVFYPLPRTGLPESPFGLEVVLAAAILLAISLVAFVERRRRPWLAVGWCWYLGVLVPMIGLVQVGNQALADRYTYLSGIGLAIPIVFGSTELGAWVEERLGRARAQIVLLPLAAAILLAFALASHRQVLVWRDHVSLFEHALAVTEGNYLAHYNLGTRALTSRPPRLGEARRHLEAAVRLDPGYAEARLNLGNVEWLEGDVVRATELYEEAVALDPFDPEAHLSLGTARFEAGRVGESLEHFERAIALEASNARAHANRATVLLNLGRLEEARRGFERALALDPGMAAAREGLRASMGR
ncbi:MAG: tetratricopeptide repeat protein [Myxococcota bacterium]